MILPTRSVVGVFARPNHPVGWGFPSPPDGQSGPYGRAHGYSVLLVACCDDDELALVEERLNDWRAPFHGRSDSGQYNDGYLGEWFGGLFDLIAKLNAPEDSIVIGPWQSQSMQMLCKGDNRFVGHFTAEEVLHPPAVETSSS